jgi:hypothetical protein
MNVGTVFEDILGLDVQNYKEIVVPHRKIVNVLEEDYQSFHSDVHLFIRYRQTS